MRDLNRYVINKHADHWKDIGLELELELDTLNIISKDNMCSLFSNYIRQVVEI